MMPYDEGFDDVYVAIKSAVEQVGEDHSINCYRLDEKNPAGRITERLRSELQHSTICIADIRKQTECDVGNRLRDGSE